MIFLSREEAGIQLGRLLRNTGIIADMVLGLPRGGVVVAAAAADLLEYPLDVLVVRKIGHPLNREFALGAMAEDGTLLLDSAAEWANSPELAAVIAEEKERLAGYSARFHPGGPPQFKDKRVLIVDDGLATGATMEVAVRSARKQAAAQVLVAIPVASDTGIARLAKVADRVIAIIEDPDFRAVGHYYQSFEQTTDDEVLHLLETHRQVKPSPPAGSPPANP